MGILKTGFSFLLGAGCGIYAAQNYDVPNMKNVVDYWVFSLTEKEKTYRKPKDKAED